ncbi:MAG: barstar family protein [Thiobacillaceae bacterium]
MPKLTEILDNPAANGIYRATAAAPATPGLIHIDAGPLADKDALLKVLGQALQFPDYYGMNWDALEECLSDLSWWAGPVAVWIDHAEALPADVLTTLVDIWTGAAAAWAEAGRGCVLILSGAIGLDGLPAVDINGTTESSIAP